MSSANQNDQELSLFSGGFINRLFTWIGLEKARIRRPALRILVFTGLAGIPLFLMCLWNGTAWGGTVRAPLLHDPAILVRLLFSLPLLLWAESSISRELGAAIHYFRNSGVIPAEESDHFSQAVASADRLANSDMVDILLMVLVVFSALFQLDVDQGFGKGASTWQRDLASGGLSAAGVWFRYGSCAIYRFIGYRWLWRLLVWSRFLWMVSKLNLKLNPTHPDLSGGLGILEDAQMLFGLIVLATSALIAGVMGRSILFGGATLQSMQLLIAGVIGVLVLAFLFPLLVFSPKLLRCRREGLRQYGSLAERYANLFGEKWLVNPGKASEEVLGTADIQSLADLANGYAVVRQMRFVPFGRRLILSLAVSAAAPFVPLAFFVFGVDEVVARVIKMLI